RALFRARLARRRPASRLAKTFLRLGLTLRRRGWPTLRTLRPASPLFERTLLLRRRATLRRRTGLRRPTLRRTAPTLAQCALVLRRRALRSAGRSSLGTTATTLSQCALILSRGPRRRTPLRSAPEPFLRRRGRLRYLSGLRRNPAFLHRAFFLRRLRLRPALWSTLRTPATTSPLF